jgi:SRSO17 transposase
VPRPAPLWDAETLLACLPDEAWEAVTWRAGTKGPLTKAFVAVRVHRATGNPDVGTNGRSVAHGRVTTGPEGWLLGERPLPGHQGEAKQSFLWLPGWPLETPLARLVTLAHARWAVEQAYEDAKGECGLDDYQGRRWDGLHRHLALTWLAYTFLVLQRLATTPLDPPDEPEAPGPPGSPPLGARADGPRPTAAAEPARRPPPSARLAAPGPPPLARRHRPHRHFPPSA